MNARFTSPVALLLALATAHCGGVVVASNEGARAPADAAVTDAAIVDAPPAVVPSPTCAEVRASCGPTPQQFVRGHAEGITGLEGARVQFAMRYVRVDGSGLNVPHGVVSAWGRVEGGAFEACVCLPRGGNEYPELAAAVFAPGTTGATSRDVVRAVYSQRYATLGDEDLARMLDGTPSNVQIEAALAAMVDRTSAVTAHGVDGSAEGARIYGGLVADERPVAAMVTGTAVMGGSAHFEWLMPGRLWPSERLVMLVDTNGDHRCNDGDLGSIVRLDGRAEVTSGAWLRGAALTPVCDGLRIEANRE